MSGGALVLVATPIGNLGDLSPRALQALAGADVVACEDTRRTRALLAHAGVRGKTLVSVHGHNEAAQVAPLLARVRRGDVVALVTDAGTPGISDPGGRLVLGATSAGLPVSVVPGASAAVAALVISGLATERYCFEGFLARRGRDRRERIAAVAAETRTTVLYEAPHRLVATLAELAEACGPARRVTLAREMTKLHEEIWRGTLAEALDRVRAVEPRGEHTLVLEGAPPPGPPAPDEIEAMVETLVAQGMSASRAAGEAAARLGVPRRQAYAAAIRASRSAG